MDFKKSIKTFGSALGTVASVVADSSAYSRIREIDEEIEKLQQEREHLKSTMFNQID